MNRRSILGLLAASPVAAPMAVQGTFAPRAAANKVFDFTPPPPFVSIPTMSKPMLSEMGTADIVLHGYKMGLIDRDTFRDMAVRNVHVPDWLENQNIARLEDCRSFSGSARRLMHRNWKQDIAERMWLDSSATGGKTMWELADQILEAAGGKL